MEEVDTLSLWNAQEWAENSQDAPSMLLEFSSNLADAPRPEAPEDSNPLIDKLNKFVCLDESDERAVQRITRIRRTMRAHDTLFLEGSRARVVCLMLTGVAIRYRFLADGRRQIFGYLLPGDICDTHHVIGTQCDHDVGLLCDSELALISTADLMTTMVEHPKIERALLMMALIEAATLREWLLNVGQRNAFEKLAHFFCEITARLNALGAVNPDGSFSMPLTQIELADTVGLTVVHVNRILQRFRREEILEWNRRRVSILNPALLKRIGGFSDNYLHLHQYQVKPNLCAYG